MATEYSDAPEVEEIARDLIKKKHKDLGNARIVYVFRNPAAKSKGRTRLGSARVVSGLNAFLALEPNHGSTIEAFFVIEIAAEEWKDLDAKQRKALVDHELTHCWLDEDGQPRLAGHDLEEFVSIVRSHGLWRPEVEAMGKAIQQRLALVPEKA